jgi:hypothetical protein
LAFSQDFCGADYFVYLRLDACEFLLQSRSSGGESGLVAGLDFKSSWDLPEGRFGGFDSHAPPPFIFNGLRVFPFRSLFLASPEKGQIGILKSM